MFEKIMGFTFAEYIEGIGFVFLYGSLLYKIMIIILLLIQLFSIVMLILLLIAMIIDIRDHIIN